MKSNARSRERVQVPDINILPAEYRRQPVSSQTWLLLMVVLVFGFAVYMLLPLRAETKAEQARLGDDLAARQQELKSLQAAEPQAKELKEAIARLEGKKKDLQSSWKTFQKSRVNWRMVLDGVQGSLPREVSIEALTQKDYEMMVRGRAPNLNAVLEYANALRRLGLTRDVGMTYEIRPEGDIVFDLRLIVKEGGGS